MQDRIFIAIILIELRRFKTITVSYILEFWPLNDINIFNV